MMVIYLYFFKEFWVAYEFFYLFKVGILQLLHRLNLLQTIHFAVLRLWATVLNSQRTTKRVWWLSILIKKKLK